MASVTVPAALVDDMRAAVFCEIASDADGIKHEANSGEVEEVRACAWCLTDDLALLAQLPDEVEGPVTVEGGREALAHVCEALARDVLAPRLASRLRYTITRRDLDELGIRPLLDGIAWAVEQAAELRGGGPADAAADAVDGVRRRFVEALRRYGATDEEVAVLLDEPDLAGVIDADALAHERLAALRRVPSLSLSGREEANR
ncbi:hypothetical protein [Thermoleophilum album]|uniref:Uncharacterized protein n=1 Tax=Thermoleophilum album TaxID=29539 RepID=A0A1H6FH31_THEAL|nr:hypothetical protein [Thermoleophilum album]SEH10157.1 hypothetical protein SAMN02745716_0003 [Thermoleophilum album]